MQDRRSRYNAAIVLSLLTILIAACAQNPTAAPETTPTVETSSEEVLVAKIEFRVEVPGEIREGENVSLEVMDEVTGLALNAKRYPMKTVSSLNFALEMPIPVGSVLKYRYVREGNRRAVEYTSEGRQTRYRMVYVKNPGVVEDKVSAWNDQPFSSSFGRIQGRVLEEGSNLPLPGTLVSAGGQQTLTSSDGTFLLDGLPPGKHNIVVYSLDGSYPPFQQEAIVAAESSTPAEIRLQPAHYVNITFLVTVPQDIPDGIPLRLVGNIYPLGNTFADLRGGVSTIASREPGLSYLGDRKYRITVRLPSGLDLRYKYTLGDGFWNSERGEDGLFNARQLIVPNADQTIEEMVGSFTTPGKAPVTFSVSVSAGLAPGEILSVQFGPFGWTEPIPMWPMGGNRWVYILYTPLDQNVLPEAGYRFCKNDQCGIADDAVTPGPEAGGMVFKPGEEPQLLSYDIRQWAWRIESDATVTVTSDAIPPRNPDFITGVELLPDYHPSWQAYLGPAYDQIKKMKSEWVILSPTWHFTSTNPPVLSAVPGQDAAWYDLSRMAILAREKGLKIAIHPSLSYYQPAETWWVEAKRDANWWQSWFDRYETYLLNYADFANQVGADALILGDPSLRPALPSGTLIDGNTSMVPGDAGDRWSGLIEKIRSRYSGKIIWRLDYPADINTVPEFVSNTDLIYVVMSGRLGDFNEPQKDEIRQNAQNVIDGEIRSLHDRFGKPLLLGIAYPSASGAASGCVHSGDSCLPGYVFYQAGLDLPAVQQNLKEQTDIYNAILEVVNKSDWISGVIASGFYPPVAIEDKSISIHGKPASDVVWFWFEHFTGDQAQ